MKDKLKEQFEGMLPYMKDKFKDLIDDILSRAEKLEKQENFDLGKLEGLIRDTDKLLETDKKMKDLFSKLNRK